MPQYNVKVKSVDKVTHDVLSIVTEKPHSFNFIPGQATEVSINKNGCKMKKDHSLSLASLAMIISNLLSKHTLRIKASPTNF